MHYVDLDPSDNEIDFGCGRQTYNKHDGTDFGISDMEAAQRGVPVLAVAKGVVLRVRDGIPDQLINEQEQKDHIKGKECGNGLVIDHGAGWQTQYCHMRQGSVLVKTGASVEKGTILGMIGSSGLASFPHVHLTVRHQEKIVDPFVGETNISGCNTERHPLWERPPDYVPTGLIRTGFAAKPPQQIELWQGEYKTQKSTLSAMPAIVFWAHLFGVLQGDVEHFTLIAPGNRVVIDREKTLSKNYRSWVSYVGEKNKAEKPLSSGVWKGRYQLKRAGLVIVDVEREFTVE